MKLLIAIPALNEEQSIAWTIERCLAARRQICAQSGVSEVEITVVSDGSTDRTVEIASRYLDQINLIVFEQNQGYGAAISTAWRESDAELLAFLDADGTCDPRYFGEFCHELLERDADIVLGCRLNSSSRMPLVRRIGNLLFAVLLSFFSLRRVRDTASGMRVVRRSSLPKLLPLPTGLHFTPAMSARALLSRDLKIIEIDMAYHERAGRSKLNPLKDGFRFLTVIMKAALLYRPARLLGVVASVLLCATCLMMAYPAVYYLQNGLLEDWMIYRFLVAELFATIAASIFCLSYLGNKAADISLSQEPLKDRYHGLWGWYFRQPWWWVAPALMTATSVALVWDALAVYVSTGRVTEHWSRFVAMMLGLSVAANVVVTKAADYCLNLLADRLEYLRQSRPKLSVYNPDSAGTARRAA